MQKLIMAVFVASCASFLAPSAEAQVLKKSRVYNNADVEIVVKIIGIGPDQNIRQELDAATITPTGIIGTKTDIFPLAVGERYVVVWDSFNETVLLGQKVPVTGNTRFKIQGTAATGYTLGIAYPAGPLDP